jgi:hypothetical protein
MIYFPSILLPVKVTPTVSLTAYSIGDAIDKAQQLTNAVPNMGGQSEIVKIVISDAAKQNAALKLLFYNKKIADATDNAAFDPTDTENAVNFIGHIDIASTDYVSLSDNSVATKIPALEFGVKALNAKNIWMQVVANGTPTFAAITDLTVTVTFKKQ